MANGAFLSPGKSTEEWARNLKLEDFELLCLDDTRKPVTEAKNCHLAVAPNHAVVSRTDKVELLQQVLLDQQVWTSRAPSMLLTALPCNGACLEVVHPLRPFFLAPLLDRCG